MLYHVRRNLKDKCVECNISVDLSQRILGDVFGKTLGNVLVEGIVDASPDQDFQNKLEDLTQSWCNCDVPSAANVEKLIEYFTTKKAPLIRDTMLRSVPEECGLVCPLDIFTTNTSESVNAIFKRKDYKKTQTSCVH